MTSFCSKIDIPCRYRNIEKCLLVLLHLIKGCVVNDMKVYTNTQSGSLFYNIYESIYNTNKDNLNKWIDEMLYNIFSNEKIRLLNSYIKNIDEFKHVTVFCDGHASRIVLEDIDMEKSELWSYKLRQNGLNTLFFIDINDIAFYITESLPCKYNNDDNLILDHANFNKFFKLSGLHLYGWII